MPAADFSPRARAYARARPGYPEALIPPLLALADVKAGDPVCEIGAGTGACTCVLARAGLALTALEPSAAMRAKAPVLDGVVWRGGTFEATGLTSASQEWVVAAQAFHWAEPARALPELARVLRPGRLLTVLFNQRENERDETLARAWRAIRRRAPGFEDVYKQVDWEEVVASTGDFEPVACHAVRHRVRMGCERFLDLWRSHHRLAGALGRAGVDVLVTELAADLEGRGVEWVDVPYLCVGWTARRQHRVGVGGR